MNWRVEAFSLVGLLVALPAFSQPRQSPLDERLLFYVHQANLREIAGARVAVERSHSDAVKRVAETMASDRRAAEQQVRAYANKHGIDLGALGDRLAAQSEQQLEFQRRSRELGSATGEWASTWENALRSEERNREYVQKLRKVDAASFDREFVDAIVDAAQHRTIRRLTNARDAAIDPELRELIDDLLPTMAQELETTEALRAAIAKA